MVHKEKKWSWFAALGVLLLILGAGVIGSSSYTTVFSIFMLATFLTIAGLIQTVQALAEKKWKGVFLSLLVGVIYLVAGLALFVKPATMPLNLTLWAAAFCFIVGLYKMLMALFYRYRRWGIVFLSGLVTFILGGMIYYNWPLSGLWVIGLFVGIDLIVSGLSWLYFAFSMHSRRIN